MSAKLASYPEGITFQSPGSRSAPWDGDPATHYPNGVSSTGKRDRYPTHSG